jgi:acyl-CoA synthetase (AMP-forming)/AMP-acid ligase II
MAGLSQLRSPYAIFAATAARMPDAAVLIAPASAALPYAPQGFRITYGALAADSARLRADYAAAGYGAGMRVALLLGSEPDFFRHWLALNALGVAIVPINPDLRPAELAYQLDMAKPALLVAAAARAALARDGAAASKTRIIAPEDAIPPAQQEAKRQDGDAASECALLFTSGSTGKPKGCILSNQYFTTLAAWYLAQGGVASLREEGEINLTPLPMFHMNALGCSALGMMAIGGAVVPLDRFHAHSWWESVAESGATMVHCLGVIPAILLQQAESAAERRHRVRFAFAPGVDQRHRAAFEARFKIPIVDAWGMTETGGAAVTTTAQLPQGFPARCIGRPCSGMAYRLVDEAGADVARGTPGELIVRAKGDDPRAGFFSSYLGDEAATEAAWAGGWFHTGDCVYADESGLLFFFDRKKSIVRRSGENIAVLEVEAALQELPDIEAVAVTPVPDALRGEEVFAFIVKSARTNGDDDPARATRLVEEAARALAYHKLPGYVAFVEALPLSATKKLARGEIKALAERAVAAGSAIDLRALKGELRKR